MQITFEPEDLKLVQAKLEGADLPGDNANALKVFDKVRAAFQQQLEEEVEYMVNAMAEDGDSGNKEVTGNGTEEKSE